MDFFTAQHRARRNSHLLIFVFLLFTTVVTVAMYAAAIAFVIVLILVQVRSLRLYWSVEFFFGICSAIGAVILAVMLYKM